MTDEQLPRKWTGELTVSPPFWKWYPKPRKWVRHSIGHGCDMVCHGCIFVPCDHPRPTIDPAEMKTMATAKEVDWT